jgi:Protein of unknown function (DUF1553)/Protein of unknown function (DUF1549)/Concanavalin A-like lectin/glucanases superfamily/Planctomycete cytochrome C
MKRVQRLLSVRGAIIALALLVSTPGAQAVDPVQYNRDVRPIFVENCFPCHGADSAARKAGLRLDRREDALKTALVPGKPDDSELIRRIFAPEKAVVMPPPKTKKTLTAEQKEALKQWIAAGAEYQPHWSFIAPKRAAIPTVKNKEWVRNPIDAFILVELEKRGLQPAPEADRRTLARRVSLDLLGLPPPPAEVEAFVNDKSPDAYEKYVDRLLQSPHWGEHRGRYWLDAARYADTHGIHFDNFREMWAYRDWVINAFNQNLPFDRFTIEQLAGDLLPNRTLEQQVASGFHRCNITTNEGGAIPEEYLVLYARDRTETTAQVWLGLTAGCAVCHDHKFDPLAQREFYSLAAFFNNTMQAGMDGNIKDTPPAVVVPRWEDRERWIALTADLVEAKRQTDARKQAAKSEFDRWLADGKPERVVAAIPGNGLRFHAALNEGTGAKLAVIEDGKDRLLELPKPPVWEAGRVAEKALKIGADSILESSAAGDFDRKQAFAYGAWVKLPKGNLTGALFARMADQQNNYRGWDLWIEGGRVGTHVIHTWPDNAAKVVAKTPLKPGQWQHVFVTYDGSGKAAAVKVYVNSVVQEHTVANDNLKDTIRTDASFKIGQRQTGSRLDSALVQDVRLYDRALSATEIEQVFRGTRAAWLSTKPADKLAEEERTELFDWWLITLDTKAQELAARLAKLRQEQLTLREKGTIAHVMQERTETPEAYVLFRGEYDKRRDAVKPSTPAILPPMPADLPRNRLGLAKWLLGPEQPLTARVTVNRYWQELFGVGLVRTSGDFGVSGELPSHPELLDWLAVEFRESGWDIKKLFKLIVLSATYRQAALTTVEKREKDPHNRYLSRGPRFRMDAEMIRDYALTASGLLVPKIGGPSVKPYQPEGVWEAVAMRESNTRYYKRDSGENLYRRSLYTFWKRSAPPAQMDIFNAPSRETCAVRRERTNTPLQALVTLNDEQFVEAARHLAQVTLKEGGDRFESRCDFLGKRLLARPFRTEERKVIQMSLDSLLAYYRGHPEDSKKLLAVGESKADAALDVATLAAWTMLANELMNLDEVLNK